MARACIRGTTKERLEYYRQIDPETGCWIWTGSVVGGRYGQTTMGDGKPMKAHRVSYLTYVGEIPDGMMVCHKCDNPRCINPEHLFLGSALDNQRDSVVKGRNARGSRQGNSKLTESDVASIRLMIEDGKSDAEISAAYHVVPANIWHIRTGRAWKHVS